MGQNDQILQTETAMNADGRPIKRCFLTVGATASFTSLIRAALSPQFLEILYKHDYTHLRIQYGKDGRKIFEDHAWVLPEDLKQRLNIDISGFDFRTDGLAEEMTAAKKGLTAMESDSRRKKRTGDGTEKGQAEVIKAGVEGCVISHAGSGSILDALRLEIPTVVVPNPDLLDNHQLELAEVLAEQNYVVHGKLDNLSDAIPALEDLRRKRKAWPPVVGTNQKTPRQALATVMDDELGWVD